MNTPHPYLVLIFFSPVHPNTVSLFFNFLKIFKDMACTCNLCIHFNFSVMEGTWFGNMDQPLRAVPNCIKCHGSQHPCRHNGAHHLSANSSMLSSQPLNSKNMESDMMLLQLVWCQSLRVLTRIPKWLPKVSRLYHVHRSSRPFWKQLSVWMLENPDTVYFIFQPIA